MTYQLTTNAMEGDLLDKLSKVSLFETGLCLIVMEHLVYCILVYIPDLNLFLNIYCILFLICLVHAFIIGYCLVFFCTTACLRL